LNFPFTIHDPAACCKLLLLIEVSDTLLLINLVQPVFQRTVMIQRRGVSLTIKRPSTGNYVRVRILGAISSEVKRHELVLWSHWNGPDRQYLVSGVCVVIYVGIKFTGSSVGPLLWCSYNGVVRAFEKVDAECPVAVVLIVNVIRKGVDGPGALNLLVKFQQKVLAVVCIQRPADCEDNFSIFGFELACKVLFCISLGFEIA
jgi:hypothetical protein